MHYSWMPIDREDSHDAHLIDAGIHAYNPEYTPCRLKLRAGGKGSLIRLMIVDDDRLMIELFEAIASFHHIEIVGKALDGDAALEIYRSIAPPPDLILMDQRMPNMGGIECMQEILKVDRSQKIIFISADADAMEDALSAGACEFLTKPCRVSEIISAITRVCGK